ncbi:MAG: prolyl oligopeptidase family serine peptidase [Clostridia bacterium]|nr:prolyl oligopeptidase family serine peptidase [Clostridia bacterium]
MELLHKTFEDMQYLIRYPKNYDSTKRYPVILFLHGAGTRSSDITVLKNNFFFKSSEKFLDLGFITVAPLCERETWCDHFETLARFTKTVFAAPDTDPARFYLTGNSMGGYGTWQLAISHPELFAAIVPVCGGGMYWDAGRLVNVPVWAFHGEKDSLVLPAESKIMVERVNQCGGNARLTLYPEAGHDAWTPTYTNREVYEWLLSHQNENAKTLVNEYAADAAAFG